MEVRLSIRIGNGPYTSAGKSIKLDITPVIGMKYADGTWKTDDIREIIEVTIEFPPVVETPRLYVVLNPDMSDSAVSLKQLYDGHGWEVDRS